MVTETPEKVGQQQEQLHQIEQQPEQPPPPSQQPTKSGRSGFIGRLSAFWGCGLLCVVGAALSLAINHLFSKILTSPTSVDPLHPLWLVCFRQIVVLLSTGPQVSFNKVNYFSTKKKEWPYLAMRSACGGVNLLCTQLALQRLTLADFATIFATMPALTLLLSWPILGERLRLTDIPIFVGSAIGVLLIMRPSFIFGVSIGHVTSETDFFFGCLYAFTAAFFQSLMFITLRKVKKVPFATVTFTYAALTIGPFFVLTIALGFFHMPPCSDFDKFLTIIVGLASSAGHLLQTLAAKSLPAGLLSLSRPVELVFQFILQIVVFHQTPHILSGIGATFIVTAMTFLAIRSYFIRKLENNKVEYHHAQFTRKCLAFAVL